MDFGNTEWTPHSNIREISPGYMHLPFQAVECFMDIEPINSERGWSEEEIGYFTQLADGKYLICHTLSWYVL